MAVTIDSKWTAGSGHPKYTTSPPTKIVFINIISTKVIKYILARPINFVSFWWGGEATLIYPPVLVSAGNIEAFTCCYTPRYDPIFYLVFL
jgi:hypothetical protein